MRLPIFLSLASVLTLRAEPGVHSDFQSAVTLSNLATNALNYTERARRALQWDDTMTAKQLVDEALSTTSEIEARRGVAGQPPRVPIFAEFEQPGFLRPLEEATKQMPGYAGLSASPFEVAPPITMEPRSSQIVRRVETPYTSIALDIPYTRARLEGARTALRWDDSYAADRALAAIQRNVDTMSVPWDRSLVRVRQNLGIARAASLDGDNAASTSALRAAANALADYEKSAPGAHVSEAKAMREQLTAPANADRVTEWWHRVNGWIRTEREYRPEPPPMMMMSPEGWPATLPVIPLS